MIGGLQMLRGLAATLVVLFHLQAARLPKIALTAGQFPAGKPDEWAGGRPLRGYPTASFAEIECLPAYATGYNEGIDGQLLYDILKGIHGADFGHPIITVPALEPDKIEIYYGDLKTPVRKECSVPWGQANVDYDGDVHFCADYNDYVIGNIRETPFFEIYNGEKAREFRKALKERPDGLFPGCVRCYQAMLCGKRLPGF